MLAKFGLSHFVILFLPRFLLYGCEFMRSIYLLVFIPFVGLQIQGMAYRGINFFVLSFSGFCRSGFLRTFLEITALLRFFPRL